MLTESEITFVFQFCLAQVYTNAVIQFKNYRGVPVSEGDSFKSSFSIPAECQANNILTCNVDDNGASRVSNP